MSALKHIGFHSFTCAMITFAYLNDIVSKELFVDNSFVFIRMLVYH